MSGRVYTLELPKRAETKFRVLVMPNGDIVKQRISFGCCGSPCYKRGKRKNRRSPGSPSTARTATSWIRDATQVFLSHSVAMAPSRDYAKGKTLERGCVAVLRLLRRLGISAVAVLDFAKGHVPHLHILTNCDPEVMGSVRIGRIWAKYVGKGVGSKVDVMQITTPKHELHTRHYLEKRLRHKARPRWFVNEPIRRFYRTGVNKASALVELVLSESECARQFPGTARKPYLKRHYGAGSQLLCKLHAGGKLSPLEP